MSKTIRVDDDTHASLAVMKGDDETFDDVISRLLENRRAAVEEGAGLWADSNAAEAARTARQSMKDGVGR